MNELAVLASETHEQAIADFKVSEKYLYKCIMKVKKIREERLYKEIGFTSFDDYCESAWKVNRGYMDDRIQLAESFGQDFDRTYGQLGHSKSLLLVRMEPEIKRQIESTINVAETPIKEIKQLETQLKQTESERIRLENLTIYQQQELNKERSKPSQIVTKEVQVVPDHVKRDLQQKDNQISNLNNSMEIMKKRLETAEQHQRLYEKDSREYKELKDQIGFLNKEKGDLSRQIESATALSGLSVKIDNFLKTELAPLRYSRALERLDSEIAVRNLTDIIHSVENWVTDMRRYLPQENRIIVEVMDYDNVS